MVPETKQVMRLLIECVDELRLHEQNQEYLTDPLLRARIAGFMATFKPGELVANLCTGPSAITTIAVTVFPNAEEWLRTNVPDFNGDRVCAVRPTSPFNPNGLTSYEDIEEDTSRECTFEDHVMALQKLCEMVGFNLFVGGIKSPLELVDPGNWDVEVVDAFWQLVYRGDVIYG